MSAGMVKLSDTEEKEDEKMLELLGRIEGRIKSCLTNNGNIILIVCIINLTATIFLYCEIYKMQKNTTEITAKIEETKIEIKKKTDHRYFNLSKSLEEIHGVKINTYNGELK